MVINPLEEILWPQFVKLDWVSKLPLNEQVQQYNTYLDELTAVRHKYYIEYQMKGSGPRIVNSGFLQQEDLFYILQEDGSKIYVTTLE